MKAQLTLFTTGAIVDLGNLKEHTASSPRLFFFPDKSQTFIAKSRMTNPAEPYTPANEYLAWEIASYLSLPIPDGIVFDFKGVKYFGSLYYQPKVLWTPQIRDKLDDRKVIPSVYSFDVFACNTDRHLNNFVFTENNSGTYNLYVIDHGRCFFGEAPSPTFFLNKDSSTDISGFVKTAPQLWIAGADISSFKESCEKLEAISSTQIQQFVDGVPTEFLSDGDKELAVKVLDSRKSKVFGLMASNLHLFK